MFRFATAIVGRACGSCSPKCFATTSVAASTIERVAETLLEHGMLERSEERIEKQQRIKTPGGDPNLSGFTGSRPRSLSSERMGRHEPATASAKAVSFGAVETSPGADAETRYVHRACARRTCADAACACSPH